MTLEIGTPVWMLVECDEAPEGYVIEENKVNEAGVHGFFISDYNPPINDIGEYILYEELGERVFMTAKAAQIALESKVECK